MSVLPKGAGGVRCLDCGAHAAADGKGTPIVLIHASDCPEEINRLATYALHSKPCPGCGMEPEARSYYRDKTTKIRCGYHCTCGAMVIRGILTGMSLL